MDESWRHAQQVILPQLHNQLQKTNNGLRLCLSIRNTIDEWLVLELRHPVYYYYHCVLGGHSQASYWCHGSFNKE